MSILRSQIRQRLMEQFLAVAGGDDLPPGPRFRLEGLMEAAVMIGDTQKELLQAMVAEIHQDIFGQTLEERLGDDWERWHPFPQLPLFASRAPVSPSTSD